MHPTRRDVLRRASHAGLLGLGYALGLRPLFADEPGPTGLVRDPQKVVDLPPGFRYVAFSRTGERMDDGLVVPSNHDGMAAFPGPDGTTILVRNHECDPRDAGPFGPRNALFGQVDAGLLYDAGLPCLGGTTSLLYDTKAQRLRGHWLSLSGTMRNCAGGPTPWGSWITCEENVSRASDAYRVDHGYCFEVPATATPKLFKAEPLRGLGRFNHEAVAVDPKTSVVYQTEDRPDGLLYRFVPEQAQKLAGPGKLQALVVADRPGLLTYNHDGRDVPLRTPLAARWVDLDETDAPRDDLRHRGHALGAARFSRGEGMIPGEGCVYFACTSGGAARKGQIWSYTPRDAATGALELVVEPNDADVLDMVDNIAVAPWGDLVACEDGWGEQFVVGIAPDGRSYKLARNAMGGSELAGATFSPDGSTLFVNIQKPGLTLAITGPWNTLRRPV